MTLQTVDSKDLQQITLRLGGDRVFTYPIDWEAICRDWLDLDQLLVQFWTLYSIRPTVTYEEGSAGEDMRDYIPILLHELTERGLVDLVVYKL